MRSTSTTARIFIHAEGPTSDARGKRLLPRKLEIIPQPDFEDVASECRKQLLLAFRLFKSAPFSVSPWDQRADIFLPGKVFPIYSLNGKLVSTFCAFSHKLADLHVWRSVWSLLRVYAPAFKTVGMPLSGIFGPDDPQGTMIPAKHAHLVVATDCFEEAHDDGRLSNELRILLLTMAAEALFDDGDKAEVAYRLSHRLAVLNGADSRARKEIFDLAREVYVLRSKVAHGSLYQRKGGFVEVGSQQVWAFSNVVRSSLLYGVALGDLDRSEVLKALDRGVFDESETLALRRKANEYWGFRDPTEEHLYAGAWPRIGV